MELKIKLPGGGMFEYKKEPMDWDRFLAICILIGIYMVGSGIIKFFSI